MAFIIVQVISNPLVKLKKNAMEIGKGNYSTKVELQSNDEIGELAEAFNSMSLTPKE